MLGLAALACSTANSSAPPAEAAPAPAPAQATAPAPTGLRPVYFDLDSALLRNDGRASLARDAEQIRSNPDWGVITIEGHCDERGNEEYNLALGERRADAVKRYLADLGVPAERLETRSHGEARPAVQGHGERAWQLNRRAQLQISD